MRVLGLDFGSRTVGVAVTDPMGLCAHGLEIIRRSDESHLRGTLRRIEELVKEYGVRAIVLGYPLHMNGSAGERARKTEAFKTSLERRTGLPVYLCDERLTTVEAEEIMLANGIRREDFADHVDRVAASVILEDWLNNDENSKLYR